jgi:flagellar hook assembly protein FlgD
LNLILGSLNLSWSGRDENGRPLANGSYLVEIHIQDGTTESLITETVTVLSSGQQAAGSLQLLPNPVAPSSSGSGSVDIRLPAGTVLARIKVYTVSGELVRRLDLVGDNASWDLKDSSGSAVSAGLYMILAESVSAGGWRAPSLGRLIVLK